MAVTQLRGGASIDIPTAQDNAAAVRPLLRHELEQWRQERAKKDFEWKFPVQPAAATFFTFPPGAPEPGYAWSVKAVTANLSAAGVMLVYKASSAGDTRFGVGHDTALTAGSLNLAVVNWSSDALRLRESEGIYVVTAATFTQVNMRAWQVPAEMVAEVYD
jgi:hypothetical protein